MIRRPPRSTLFPTRRSSDLTTRSSCSWCAKLRLFSRLKTDSPGDRDMNRGERQYRSEEHTSELQSRLHLVCRLLLEKKKKKEDTATAQKSSAEPRYVHSTQN